MFHSRKLNNRINKLQKKALHLVYNDSSSSFSHHHRNIQKFAIEIYKVKHHDEQSRTKNLEFPLEIKNSEKKNLLEKKNKWKQDRCPCRLCKSFIINLDSVSID